MIDVKGMTQAQAESMLKEKNISYTVEEKASNEDKGTVVDQTPAAGTTISSATRVVIYVSSGAESFELKDYSGLTLDMVKTALQSLKLEAGEVTYEYSDDIDKDKVIKTNPEAGTKVKEGDKIGIVLSKGPEEKMTTMPTVIGLTESQAKTAVENANLVYGGATFESSEDVEKGKIMHFAVDGDRNVYEGQQVKEGSTVTVIVSSGSQYEGQTITISDTTGGGFDGEASSTEAGDLKIELTIDGVTTTPVDVKGVSQINYGYTVSGPYGKTGILTFFWNGVQKATKTVTFIPTAG
jgi:eukaryotic-like serine/threonine-protein kinase